MDEWMDGCIIHLWYYFTLFKTQMRTYLFVILCINKFFNTNSIQWMDGWNTRRLRSSNSLLLSNQKCNLYTYAKRRFSVSAPVLWNNLPLHLRRCNSIKTFKKAVKNHLLCSTWDLGLILCGCSMTTPITYVSARMSESSIWFYLILFYHLIYL